jgi:segregation and condensation protein B
VRGDEEGLDERAEEILDQDPEGAAEVPPPGEEVLPAGGDRAAGADSSEPPAEPLIRLSREELQGALEALLFSTGEPIPIRQLAELFEAPVHDVREAIEELRLEYVNSRRAFRVEDIAGGVQVLTLTRYEPWIRRYLSRARDSRLSPAAFETLAVIAYKQPINKADLEGIRGVQCGPILKTLMDKNLVKVVGREDTLGKPLLYGTTKRFLESFGLSSITGLPQPELDAPGARPPRPPSPSV